MFKSSTKSNKFEKNKFGKKGQEVQIFVQLITIINYPIKFPTIIYTKMTIIIR